MYKRQEQNSGRAGFGFLKAHLESDPRSILVESFVADTFSERDASDASWLGAGYLVKSSFQKILWHLKCTKKR